MASTQPGTPSDFVSGPPQGVSWAALLHTYEMCDNSHMATNLAIDDRLLEEARRIGGQKTKRATVTEALSEYIQRRKQQQIVELFGKLDVDPTYDYREAAAAQVNVLVDTSVWSLALRRPAAHGSSETAELVELIREGRVAMIGAIRQEILWDSGSRAVQEATRSAARVQRRVGRRGRLRGLLRRASTGVARRGFRGRNTGLL